MRDKLFLERIFSFLSIENKIIAISKKTEQLFVIEDCLSVFDLSFSPTYLYELFDKSVLIVDKLNYISAIFNGVSIDSIDSILGIVIQEQDERYLVFYLKEEGIKKYGLFDCINRKIMWTKDISTSLHIVNNIVLNQNLLLNRYDVENGNLLWQFSLSDFPTYKNHRGEDIEAKIQKIIGVYNNILWLYISARHLVGIDVETGKKIHHIEDIAEFVGLKGEEKHYLSGRDYHLDEQQGKIKALVFRYYVEINLNTLKGEVKKDFGENFQTSWRITRSQFYEGDDNLYFVGAKNGEAVLRAVGIFDTKKYEVIWYDEPLKEKKFLFFVGTPQANEKYLGILDSENNLRIYEK